MAQDRPDDASHLGSQCHNRDIAMGPRQKPTKPCPQLRIAFPERWHCGPRALDQHFAQIFAPALRYAQKTRLPACRCLTGDKPKPSRQVTAACKGPRIADRGNQCCRIQSPDARDSEKPARMLVTARMVRKFLIERLNPLIESCPTVPHILDETMDAQAQSRSLIIKKFGKASCQFGAALWYDVPSLQGNRCDSSTAHAAAF
jgi:hypothetical protein